MTKMTKDRFLQRLEKMLKNNRDNCTQCPSAAHYLGNRSPNGGCRWCIELIMECGRRKGACPCKTLGQDIAIERAWEVINKHKKEKTNGTEISE